MEALPAVFDHHLGSLFRVAVGDKILRKQLGGSGGERFAEFLAVSDQVASCLIRHALG